MEHVISQDSTPIAYERSGHGPPLVLVHGTTADHTRWAPVLSALNERFTVYAVDRRGRGGSGDAPTYAIEREFEDVAAVVESIGGPVNLLGHSYGALCSLEAARHTSHLRRLILYEPPFPTGIGLYSPAAIERIRAQLEAGDREDAVTTFLRDIAQTPPQEIEILRSLPAWQARVAAAHTISREVDGSNSYVFDPTRFTGLTIPTLLLLGGDSPPFIKGATETVHAALPHSRIAVMPGQQHTAMNTAPALFVREVVEFLTEGAA